MATDLKSLFGSILTPETLQAQQAAQEQAALQYYAQQNDRPWQFLLERSLNNVSAALPNSRQNQEKARAMANEEVLKRSTARYGQMVQEGADPGKAQLEVLDSAISEFAQSGNYEAISALAPTYLSLQAKQAEMAKLAQQTKTEAAQQIKAEAEAATVIPLAQERLDVGASTRSLQRKQGQKIDQELAKTEGLQIVDLTQPDAGPVVASVDPKTRQATITNAEGITKVLKPGQYKEVGTKGGDGGPGALPSAPTIDQLTKAGTAVTKAVNLNETFKPEYGGYKANQVADVSLMAKRRVFRTSEEAAWWMRKKSDDNVLRNELFGSALTANELAAWESANPSPADSPDLIATKLKEQEQAAKAAARKLQKGYSMFLGEEATNAFMFGDTPVDLSNKAPAPKPASGGGSFNYVPGKGLVPAE